jgi:signal transduction histidine kinase
MRGGLTLRTVLASGLLALLLGGVFTVLLLTNLDQRDARTESRHARAELAAAERLLKLLIDVETGQRGFVITGEERFLEPWRAAIAAFPKEARALAAFADPAAQARVARQIARDGTSYIRDYSVPLVNDVRSDKAAARGIEATDEGRRRVDALRGRFDRFTKVEQAVVAANQARVDDDAQRAIVVAAVGLGGTILLIALFSGYLARAVVLPIRRAAAMAGRLAGGDLTVRMVETGTAEIGELERSFNTMGSALETSRDELRQRAEEQASLRRVATLVAEAVPASEVWDAVVTEVDRMLNPDTTALVRYEPDGTAALIAAKSSREHGVAVGSPYPFDEGSIVGEVLRTGHGARKDVGRPGIRSEVGAPIVVEGRLWGVIAVAFAEEPADATEDRVAEFTELVATAIANAEGRAALTESRARVVATGDETRRRIERDVHDGAQQRLVHTIISLKLARRAMGDDAGKGAELVDEALENAESANAQLRELVRGILPAVLKRGGLQAGVEALATHAPLPVSMDVTTERLPDALEATAYFILSEALTNVVKHAGARTARIAAVIDGQTLKLEVRDDGVGGADADGGSGLLGLADRVAAAGGELRVDSPPGGGTVIAAALPIRPG